MTVSPAGTPAPEQPALPDSIGWLFVEKYYEVYTRDIANLYKLYDKQAVVSHDQFPALATQDDAKVEFQARGTEAIRSHFRKEAGDSPKTNRVVITSADFQFSFKESILIVVCGEWARGDSQYWQFIQTFVLTPSKEKVYDVANDVLKFVDFGEFRDTPVVKREQEAVSKAESGKTESEKPEPKEEKTQPKDEKPVSKAPEKSSETAEVSGEKPTENGQKTETKAVKQEPKPEKVSVEAEAVENAASSTEQTVSSSEKEAASTEKEAHSTDKVEEAPREVNDDENTVPGETENASPAQPILWAALAAKEPPKSTVNNASVASPSAAKAVPTPTPVVKKPTPPQQAPPPYANGKFKKSDWFPIYVRNVEVGQEELKAALDKQFGKTKYFAKNERVVLCDFYTREAQEKALKAKEIRLGNNTIYLEPREARNHKDAKKKTDKKVGAKKNPKPAPVKKA